MKYGTMMYLVSKSGNVAMIKKSVRENDPNSGYCTLPGGKLNSSEKGLQNPLGRLESVVRETKEEIGLEVLNPILRGVILFDNKERQFDNWNNPDNFLVYIFASSEYSGKLKTSDEGKPITVPLNKVDGVPSNPGDKKMYDWLKDGRNFFGVIKHKGTQVDEEGTWVDFY